MESYIRDITLAPATLRIAHSLVEGGASGTLTCFQNYDAGFAPVAC